MFDRLKSLPLTILLTILIWMYAESQVTSARNESRLEVDNVPIWISGPPELLSNHQVVAEPKSVNIVIAGPKEQIDVMRRLPMGQDGIYAYVDIEPTDRPSPNFAYRPLRFVTPPGTSVVQVPDVGFRILDGTRPTATNP